MARGQIFNLWGPLPCAAASPQPVAIAEVAACQPPSPLHTFGCCSHWDALRVRAAPAGPTCWTRRCCGLAASTGASRWSGPTRRAASKSSRCAPAIHVIRCRAFNFPTAQVNRCGAWPQRDVAACRGGSCDGGRAGAPVAAGPASVQRRERVVAGGRHDGLHRRRPGQPGQRGGAAGRQAQQGRGDCCERLPCAAAGWGGGVCGEGAARQGWMVAGASKSVCRSGARRWCAYGAEGGGQAQ